MGVLDRLYEAAGLITKQQFEQRLTEASRAAYSAGYSDGNDDPASGDIKQGGQGYRVAGRMLRDFSQVSYDKIIEAVWSVYQSNPVAKRVLALIVAYVVGRGITYAVEDDGLRDVLDRFWRVNRLEHRLKQFVLQLGLWGEQVYPAFVRLSDGLTRLGYIDPGQVKDVKCHPNNAMEKWAVVLKRQTGAPGEFVYRIIREQEPVVKDGRVVDTANAGKLVLAEQATLEPWETEWLKSLGLSEYSGSCFLFQVNNVSNQSRGFSDLLQVLDWLDQLDQTLFEIGEKEQFAGYFSWFVKLIGVNDVGTSERARQIRATPPKKGSVNVSNDREEWTLMKPDLKQTESIAVVRTQLTFILGGLGIPEHWYANGDAANRATAAEQGDPSWKALEDRQSYVGEMVHTLLRFQRDQAEIAGAWTAKSGEAKGPAYGQPVYDIGGARYIPLRLLEARTKAQKVQPLAMNDIDVLLPEMTSKDTNRVAQTLNATTSSLTVGEQNGYVSHETAAKIWGKVASELGVEVDAAEELAKAEEEKPEKPEPSPLALMTGGEDEPDEGEELEPERQGRNGTER